MSENPIDETTLESLHFFGTISASFSHEINNVVSIVNELSGLISDYLAAAEDGRPVDMLKLKDKNEKIMKATKRGEVIIKNFNRFAHGADKPTQIVQLDELLDNFVSLTQRIADLKGVTISFAGREKSEKTIECNPFLVMNVLFMVIRDILSHSDNGTEIDLSALQNDGKVRINVKSQVEFKISDNQDARGILENLLNAIGGTLESDEPQNGTYVTALSLPG